MKRYCEFLEVDSNRLVLSAFTDHKMMSIGLLPEWDIHDRHVHAEVLCVVPPGITGCRKPSTMPDPISLNIGTNLDKETEWQELGERQCKKIKLAMISVRPVVFNYKVCGGGTWELRKYADWPGCIGLFQPTASITQWGNTKFLVRFWRSGNPMFGGSSEKR